MKIQEALLLAFGESAKKIDGFDKFNNVDIDVLPACLVIDDQSRLNVLCAGLVIVAFHNANRMRGRFYVCVDNDDAKHWMWQKHVNKKDAPEIAHSCPSTFLRLVMSD